MLLSTRRDTVRSFQLQRRSPVVPGGQPWQTRLVLGVQRTVSNKLPVRRREQGQVQGRGVAAKTQFNPQGWQARAGGAGGNSTEQHCLPLAPTD